MFSRHDPLLAEAASISAVLPLSECVRDSAEVPDIRGDVEECLSSLMAGEEERELLGRVGELALLAEDEKVGELWNVVLRRVCELLEGEEENSDVEKESVCCDVDENKDHHGVINGNDKMDITGVVKDNKEVIGVNNLNEDINDTNKDIDKDINKDTLDSDKDTNKDIIKDINKDTLDSDKDINKDTNNDTNNDINHINNTAIHNSPTLPPSPASSPPSFPAISPPPPSLSSSTPFKIVPIFPPSHLDLLLSEDLQHLWDQIHEFPADPVSQLQRDVVARYHGGKSDPAVFPPWIDFENQLPRDDAMALRQMEGIPAALWMKEGNILLAGSGLRGLRATLRGKSSPGVKMAGIRVLAGMVDRGNWREFGHLGGVSERVLRVVANETVRLLAGKQAADLFVQTVEMSAKLAGIFMFSSVEE